MATISVRYVGTTATTNPLVSYVVYLHDLDNDLFVDFDDDTLKAFGSCVTPELEMVESTDIPGVWEASYALAAGFTGTLEVIYFNVLETAAASRDTIYVVNDVPTRDLAAPQVFIDTHTGGFENLMALDAEGSAVAGALVRVYTSAAYGAGNYTATVGVTSTDTRGYWVAPVPVTAGATYVVHMHLPMILGPAVVNVTV